MIVDSEQDQYNVQALRRIKGDKVSAEAQALWDKIIFLHWSHKGQRTITYKQYWYLHTTFDHMFRDKCNSNVSKYFVSALCADEVGMYNGDTLPSWPLYRLIDWLHFPECTEHKLLVEILEVVIHRLKSFGFDTEPTYDRYRIRPGSREARNLGSGDYDDGWFESENYLQRAAFDKWF